jgi:hypothetical protein
LAPQFEPSASRAAAALAQTGLAYDRVRVIVVRPPTDTLKDTTITFHASDSPVTLELSVLATPDEQLSTTLQYESGTTVLFEGKATVTALAATTPLGSAKPTDIVVVYVGPGATATRLTVLPGAGTYASGTTTQFSAEAFDANNVVVPNTPIVWSVSDTSLASIDATGLLTPKVSRATLVVNAVSPKIAVGLEVHILPLATGLRVVQGAAQTGPPGSQLPLPVIVQAVGADGLPGLGAGLTATFVANAGGSVTPSSVAVSADGRAQSLFTLGSNAGGIFIYTATVGAFSVLIPEIAVVGPPTQLIPSGSTTLTLTAGVAPDTLPTFRVADALGNSVPGVPLLVTVSKGAAGSTSFPFLADTIGLVKVSTVVPVVTVAGTFTVTIASGNTAVSFPSLTYTVTVLPAAAAKLGFGQVPTSASATAVLSPVTVNVQDSFGNTVTSSSAAVTISLESTTGAGETLTGGGPVTAVNGVATFTGLKIAPAKTSGVRVLATSGTLTSVLSALITITP